MNKYTDEQLQAMAIASKRYRAEASGLYAQMIMHIMMFTGMDQQQVEQNIEKLSRGERV